MEEIMFTARNISAAMLLGLLTACSSAEQPVSPESATASGSNICINTSLIANQTIVSDEEIRFEMRNGDVWANKLPRKCPGLKFQGSFAWDVSGGTVCSNLQTIHVLNHGPSCQIGAFTKLPPAPAPASAS